VSRKDDKTPHVDQSVTTHHQSGGIAAHHVHISALQPLVSVEVEKQGEPSEGGYTTTFLVHLEAPYVAQNLAVFVAGPASTTMGLNRVDPAASLSTGSVTVDGKPGTIVGPPLTSDYRVFVTTERPDPPLEIEARLNVRPDQGRP
jgi:hypothetical protein